MGAKAWFIAYYDDDPKLSFARSQDIDRAASLRLAQHLFPRTGLVQKNDGNLSFLNPEEGEVYVGCYPGLKIVAHVDLGLDYPSQIGAGWLDQTLGRHAYLHATHSVVDWFAFGLWKDSALIRSLGVLPDHGIQENFGEPLPFEQPYWDGEHSVETDEDYGSYPLPFDPLELSEESMLQHLGFQFEGLVDDWICEPSDVPILTFSIQNRSS